MEEIFDNIIKKKKWTQHPCGPGSTLQYTEHLRKNLSKVLDEYDINSMLDIPCGDFSWMSTINFPSGFTYIGADIVSDMILNVQIKYPNFKFIRLDITKDKLPTADLFFIRDCLLHFSFKDIRSAFENIIKSNPKYIMTSNWFEGYNNFQDINTGNGRTLNFLESPFNFGLPLVSIKDYIKGFPKRKMLLWKAEVIQNYLNNND